MKSLKWSKGKGLIVFDTDFRGVRSMNNFNYEKEVPDETETFDNELFEDTLTYTGYEQGRSRVNMKFHSNKFNARVYMFLTDFNELMLSDTTAGNGSINGRFTFVKRGANYGIKMVFGDE